MDSMYLNMLYNNNNKGLTSGIYLFLISQYTKTNILNSNHKK